MQVSNVAPRITDTFVLCIENRLTITKMYPAGRETLSGDLQSSELTKWRGVHEMSNLCAV